MLLPKIDESIAENVHREAMRDLVQYVRDKALTLNVENPVLSEIVHSLSTETASGDDVLYKRIYFALLVALNVVNTQLEVNDLKEMWN